MKLIIDIPEVPLYRDMYTAICENGYIFDEDNEYIAKAIRNGTPIPDNATNGEVFGKIMDYMFMDDAYITTDKHGYLHLRGVKDEWWNAPYQKGDK